MPEISACVMWTPPCFTANDSGLQPPLLLSGRLQPAG